MIFSDLYIRVLDNLTIKHSMKQNWRIFEVIISVIQIGLGVLILFVVTTTIIDYYSILWRNPLMAHKSILEVGFRKNYILVIVAFISISSGILLIKNSLKGWITGIAAWVMSAILLMFSFYRIFQKNPADLNFMSKIIMSFTIIAFLIIAIVLCHSEFKQKYKPTASSWITIAAIIIAIISAKFIYS
jgi:amino acid permease